MLEEKMTTKLQQLENSEALRVLNGSRGLIDFSSNDYLGLAKRLVQIEPTEAGSTGSRLISGNSHGIEQFEEDFASYVHAESALFFANGYLANLGLFSCIAKRDDTILYDQFVHASIRDGIALSTSKKYSFKHNCLTDLRKKLEIAQGERFVVVESVYSMNGDSPDFKELIDICQAFGAYLIVDEAHGMGAIGDRGAGLMHTLRLQHQVFSRIFPLGKAFGMEGAMIVGSTLLRKYLVNFSRPFIFTTGPAPFKMAALAQQFEHYKSLNFVNHSASLLKQQLIKELGDEFRISTGPFGNIVMLTIGGNEKVIQAAEYLQTHGLDVKGIRSPTVPLGQEGLRICIHSHNTSAQIDQLCFNLHQFLLNLPPI
jgi:8-amino-7-oxononanoate synthase